MVTSVVPAASACRAAVPYPAAPILAGTSIATTPPGAVSSSDRSRNATARSGRLPYP